MLLYLLCAPLGYICQLSGWLFMPWMVCNWWSWLICTSLHNHLSLRPWEAPPYVSPPKMPILALKSAIILAQKVLSIIKVVTYVTKCHASLATKAQPCIRNKQSSCMFIQHEYIKFYFQIIFLPEVWFWSSSKLPLQPFEWKIARWRH